MNNVVHRFSPFFFYLLLLRASLDPLLNLTKFGGIGLGALLNLAVVAVFFFLILHYRFQIPLRGIQAWWVFLLFGALSIFISPEKLNSFRSYFSILTYFSVFIIPFYFIKTKVDVADVIKLIVYSAIIPLAFVLKDFALPAASTTKDGFRLFSTFSHPNIFAFYLVLIASVCFYSIKSRLVMFDANFIRRAKYILGMSIVCLLLTKTRSAWVALILVFVVYGLICERRYIIYLAVLGCLAMLIPAIQDRVFDLFTGNTVTEGEALNSLAWREVVWTASWDYILDKPIFGHGYNTFSYYFLDFFPLEESKGFDAHNAYVQIAFDMGFFGVFGYLILFILNLKKILLLFKFDKPGCAILGGLMLSYMLVSYSDNMLFYLSYNWYFWFLFGVIYFYPIEEIIKENHNV